MLGPGGWAARSGGISGLGVKLRTGDLLFPHLLGSAAAREKGDRPPSGIDSVPPDGCQALAFGPLVPAVPKVVCGAGRRETEARGWPTVTPEGSAYTAACFCLGTGEACSPGWELSLLLVCFLFAARCPEPVT